MASGLGVALMAAAVGGCTWLSGCSASSTSTSTTMTMTTSVPPSSLAITGPGSTTASTAGSSGTVEVLVLLGPAANDASARAVADTLRAIPGATNVRGYTSTDAAAEMRCLYPAQASRLEGFDPSVLPPSVRATIPASTVVDQASLRLLPVVADVVVGTPPPPGVTVTTPSCLPAGTPLG